MQDIGKNTEHRTQNTEHRTQIICLNHLEIGISQRARNIVARFFIALFVMGLAIPCQADNQSSVMQKIIAQQSVPSSNLFLVSKGFESVVRDVDAYLAEAKKGQIPAKDVHVVVQQQKGLLMEMDGDIVKALSEEGERLKQQGFLLKQHEVFVQRYRQNMDGLLKALEQIIKANDDQLTSEIESALKFIPQLIPQKETPEPYPSLPQPPANVLSIRPPMESVTIDESMSSFEEDIEKNKKQLAPSMQSAPLDMSALLSETPDIQITPEIKQLAEKLGHDPTRIFEWVYNNIDYIPYYGSFKGSQHTLLEKSGNDWDTCSLLMALYRASNIPCRYVRGVIRMDIETAKNWVGVNDAGTTYDVFHRSGYPIKNLLSNDGQRTLGFDKLEHVIVEAYLPYGNYRGIQNDSTEKIWIPLDPSFKEYEYIEGNLNARNVSFATSTYYAKVQESSPVEYYKTQLIGNQDEMRLTRQIKQKSLEFLPERLPYYGSNKGNKGIYYSYCIWRGMLDVLTSLEERHRFRIFAGAGYSEVETMLSFPNAYGKRLILSYEPATDEDKKVIEEGHFYLAKFKAILSLDGKRIAEGKKELTANEIGRTEWAGIYPIHPACREEDPTGNGFMGKVDKFTPVIIGGWHTFVVDTDGDMKELIQRRIEGITEGADSEIIGEILHITGLRYFNECEKQAKDVASLNHYYYQPRPISAILSQRISPIMLAGNITGFELTNEFIDAGLWNEKYSVMLFPSGRGDDMNEDKLHNLVRLISTNKSCFEHKVLEDSFDVPAVSAVKILQLANEKGIPIRYITADNISVLNGMDISDGAKKEIRDSLTKYPKRVVIVPEKEFEYYDYVGTGFIVEDPEIGNGTYMLVGYLRGGATAVGLCRAKWITEGKYATKEEVEARLQKVKDYFEKYPTVGLSEDFHMFMQKELTESGYLEKYRWYNEINKYITNQLGETKEWKAYEANPNNETWANAHNASLFEAKGYVDSLYPNAFYEMPWFAQRGFFLVPGSFILQYFSPWFQYWP
ncbi:MAG: transglutaminase family protein [Candidatus Desantisbacteria bacterium]